MPAIHYVYSIGGMELTFRLEFHADPPVRRIWGRPHSDPNEAATSQLTRAACLQILDPESAEIRLATPAERLEWGEWLLARIEERPELRREIHERCLAEADACEPVRRFKRVSARWKRAA